MNSGKKLLSIVLTVMLVLTAVAMIVPVSARLDRTFLVGEKDVDIFNCTGATDAKLVGPSSAVGDTSANSVIIIFDSANNNSSIDTSKIDELVAGQYNISEGGPCVGKVTFVDPSLKASTTSAEPGYEGEEIEHVAKGDNIVLNATTNLEIMDALGVTFKLSDESTEYTKVGNKSLEDVAMDDVSTGNAHVEIDTDDLKVGTYTLSIATNNTSELDVEGDSVTFDVTELGLSDFSADETSVAVGGEVVFSGSTTPFKNVSLSVESGLATAVWWQGGQGQVANDTQGNNTCNVTVKDDGTFSATANFTTDGIYKIRAALTDDPTQYENIIITVTEVVATVDTAKTAYTSGEEVIISGTSTGGDTVIIAIDDVVQTNNTNILSSNTFRYKWDTGSFTAGVYSIDVWVIPSTVPEASVPAVDSTVVDDKIDGKPPDASTSVLLISPLLSAQLSKKSVAKEDDLSINGTATGQNNLYLWIFDSKGTTSGGTTIFQTISVASDGSFDRKLPSGATAEIGTYNVFVLSEGRDKESTTKDKYEEDGEFDNMTSKSGARIMAILEDEATSAASDDPYVKLSYTVVLPAIYLDTIADVGVGIDFIVMGTTNRQDGTRIILTITGPEDFEPKRATVTDGKYSGTFDATDKPIGTYSIKADDLSGNTATGTVNLTAGGAVVSVTKVELSETALDVGENVTINATVENTGNVAGSLKVIFKINNVTVYEETVTVEAETSTTVSYATYSQETEGSFEVDVNGKTATFIVVVGGVPTATVTLTATATATATATPTVTVTPTPVQPGFEAVLAIAGLLAVAYLVLRREE